MTLTDLQRDILVKAAEGIQEGMWCRGYAFTTPDHRNDWTSEAGLFTGDLTLEQAARSQRCAIGELAYRTLLLGGSLNDFQAIKLAAEDVIECTGPCDGTVVGHNDDCMKTLDTFSAGQEWARIFREVADA